MELHFRVKEIVAGTDAFIKNESIAGPLMVFPWLRHLPFIAARFRASKVQGPIKMRQLQVGNIMGCYLFTTLKLVITKVAQFVLCRMTQFTRKRPASQWLSIVARTAV